MSERSLINRIAVIKDKKIFSSRGYTNEFVQRFPEYATKVDAIRSVWNYRGLKAHEDIVLKFEILADELKAS